MYLVYECSAADLCKAAMLQIELALRKNQNVKARLLVQIHDELLLEVADEDLSTVQEIVRTVMEDDKGLCGDMVELKVPLKISLNVGKTWGHMTPV
ncbi:hypothetical protein KUTeg_010647 [Tegillarca granosa]|uniref:DNA-directed DNA polymerase family A palm domain-containing protein n=1 Tax=Tegillarca granosa TaxID=220873 RepID=A0ABQ9F689_TEGGR|nr:hypothetical protein KUTeg_010647 [Tegillarca granosa]